jgi:putative MFS transporter
LIFIGIFFLGFGSGGGDVTRGTLLTEWLPVSVRGGLVGTLGAFWPIGGAVASAIAWGVIGSKSVSWLGEERADWRTLFRILGTIQLCFISVCHGFGLIPESPRWLCLQNREDEAKALVQHCFGLQRDTVGNMMERLTDSVDLGAEKEIAEQEQRKTTDRPAELSYSAIFHPKLRKTSVILWIIWFSVSFGSAGFFILLPTLLKNAAFTPVQQRLVFFVANLGGIPGALASSALLETSLGRKNTLIVSLFLTALVQLLVLSVGTNVIAMGVICFLQQTTAMSVWAVIFAYTPEVSSWFAAPPHLILGVVLVPPPATLLVVTPLPIGTSTPLQVYPTSIRTKVTLQTHPYLSYRYIDYARSCMCAH